MNVNFVLIQLIGVVAWMFIFFSFYRKNTDKILIFQVVASVLYCIHYYFLDAYSGLLMCALSALFDYAYYKTDKDKYLYLVSIPLRIICGLFSYNRLIDVLPIIASLLDGYILTREKKIVLVGSIVYYLLWVIYNAYVMSYAGVITDSILVLSNLGILLFNYNIFDKTRNMFKR